SIHCIYIISIFVGILIPSVACIGNDSEAIFQRVCGEETFMPLTIFQVVPVRALTECICLCVFNQACVSFNFGGSNDAFECQLSTEPMVSCAAAVPKPTFGHWRKMSSLDSTSTEVPITSVPTTTVDSCPGSVEIESAATYDNAIQLVDVNNKYYTANVNADGTLVSLSGGSNVDHIFGGLIEVFLMREINDYDHIMDSADDVTLFFNGNDVHCMDTGWQTDGLSSKCTAHGSWTQTIAGVYGVGIPSTIKAAVEATATRAYLFDDVNVYISDRPGTSVLAGTLTDSYGIRDTRADNLWVGIPSGITAVSGTHDSDKFIFFVGKEYYVYDTITKQITLGPLCVGN
ncbi:unnamed protein product, partial [Owenia fusiformis]